MNEDLIQSELVAQLNFLTELRRMYPSDLRRKYNSMFGKSKYFVPYTKDIPRDWIERRMFYAFCMKHPCYKKGSKSYIEFQREGKRVLLDPPVPKPQEELLRERLGSRVVFNKHNIARMTEHEVDGYLALLGYDVEGTPAQKKQSLWEAVNSRSGDLPPVLSKMGKEKRLVRKRSSADNKFVLVDLVLLYPKMGWPEFQEVFGEIMPNVTRGTFFWARWYVRKTYGTHTIPRLPKGRRRSQIATEDFSDQEGTVKAEKPKYIDPHIKEVFQDDHD